MNTYLCKLLFFTTIFVVLSVAQPDDNVLKFKPMPEDDILNILARQKFRNQPIQFYRKFLKSNIDAKNRLRAFKWLDCGNSSSAVVFKDIKLIPDPIKLPGSLTVSARIEVKKDIGELSADVKLKKVYSAFDIPIPCIDNFGSCYYKHVCPILSKIPKCPPILTKYKIPCKCPFKQGKYDLPSTEFHIINDPVPEGDYNLNVVLTQGKQFIGCLDLTVSFTT